MDLCFILYTSGIFALTLIICYILFKKAFSGGSTADLAGKHVLITGGSEGIGLAVAEEVLRRGAHVTLVSRSRAKLEQAQNKLHEIASLSMRKIHIRPCDVCSPDVEKMVSDAETALGPIFMLVNCAGFAVPARFEDLTMEQVKMMMDVNFMGTFSVTQAVVKRMKTQQTEGKARKGVIVITSSQGGLLGIYGFSGYAGTKAALIKFGEAIHMELLPHHISVTVSLPPDTDTPGFSKENESKPTECKIISESGGLFKPEEVAKVMVEDALKGNFFSYIGFESFMLSNMCAGMSPLTNFGDFVTQVFLSGVFRLVSSFYLFSFSRTVANEHLKRSNSKKRE